MTKIDRIIEIIRENMVVSTGGLPTNNISGGNIAKFDPVISFKKRGKVDYRRVPNSYKIWVKNLENK